MQSKSSFNLHKKAIKSFSSTTFSSPTPCFPILCQLLWPGQVADYTARKLAFFIPSQQEANLLQRFSCFLLCVVFLGRPSPEVRWLINGLQVDDQTEHNSGDVIENRLLWPAVQRSDLNSIFTCQALNTKLVEPKETSFVLDMNCELDIEFLSLFFFVAFICFHIKPKRIRV